MRADKSTILGLFNAPTRYIIPLFQRPYVWTEDRQWEPLWQDILAKTQQVLQQTNSPSHGLEVRAHFMGAVVMSQISTKIQQVPAWDVIDGQQRITTYQILLLALRDYIRTREAEAERAYLPTLQAITTNTGVLQKPEEAHKVWPTTSDRKVFEAVVGAGSTQNLENMYPRVKIKYTNRFAARPKLVEAYLFFHEAIGQFVEKTSDEADGDSEVATPAQRIEALTEALLKRVEIVTIYLEHGDDPQIIFETLNGRGEPLLAADLVRNFLFLEANRTIPQNVDALYESQWKIFDAVESDGSGFWKQSERQGRLIRSRFDTFLFHYVTCRSEKEILLAHIFQEFRDWYKSEPTRDVAQELGELQRFGKAFRLFLTKENDDAIMSPRLNLFARRLQVLETSTIYPLLLFLVCENANQVPQEEQDGIYSDLESYLVRRMVCARTTKPYNRTFLLLLRHLRALNRPVLRTDIQNYLLALSGATGDWPDDATFKQNWVSQQMYRTLSNARLQLLLGAINAQLHTVQQEQIELTAPLTIEHIMPQYPTEADWPFPALYDADEDARAEYRQRRYDFIHTIGNLTLLTGALNSSLGNSSFASKRGDVLDKSVLQINRYFLRFSEGEDWTEERIAERGRHLFEVAKSVWPRPILTALR